jgi:ornithine cyclodeaminase/alanine dehydrogenase-like protein (mu-crystallin family)
VYGRDVKRRENFCKEMRAYLGISVYAAESSEEALKNVDVVCTATTASRPVIRGADLAPGAHINAIGANHAHKRELDDQAVSRAGLIVVDSIEQARQEAGDLIIAFHHVEPSWARVRRLCDLVAGKTPGRTSDEEITLFKSNGIASWDLAAALKVYALAREKGLGREIPLWTT